MNSNEETFKYSIRDIRYHGTWLSSGFIINQQKRTCTYLANTLPREFSGFHGFHCGNLGNIAVGWLFVRFTLPRQLRRIEFLLSLLLLRVNGSGGGGPGGTPINGNGFSDGFLATKLKPTPHLVFLAIGSKFYERVSKTSQETGYLGPLWLCFWQIFCHGNWDEKKEAWGENLLVVRRGCWLRFLSLSTQKLNILVEKGQMRRRIEYEKLKPPLVFIISGWYISSF